MKSTSTHYMRLSLVLLLVGISIVTVQYKVPSILDPITAQYGMTSSTASWLMSIFTAMGIFLSIPTGSLAKIIGSKRVLLLSCGIVITGGIIGGFSTKAWLMIFSRAIEGIGFVFITVAAPLAIEKHVDAAHQGTANGIWSLWICLGSLIGSTATPMVFEKMGLTGTWLLYSAFVAAAAIMLAVFVRVPKECETDESERIESDANHYRSLLKPRSLLYFFAYLVFNIEILAVLSYTPTFLQSQGMNASLSGFASALPGLFAIPASLVFGYLIDKTGRTKPFYLAAAVAAAPATFLMLTQSGPLLWAGAALMGLVGYGIPVAALSSLPQIAGSKAAMPAAMSVLMLVQCLGEFIGSFATPLLLGADLSNWLLCATVIGGVLGTASVLSIALCKFR